MTTKVYFACKPFFWNGENIGVGEPVKMTWLEAGERLQAGQIAESKSRAVMPKKGRLKAEAAERLQIKKYYATRSFFWQGQNIEPGDCLELNWVEAGEMLANGGVAKTRSGAALKRLTRHKSTS